VKAAVVNGQWSMSNGHWAVIIGQWAIGGYLGDRKNE
jgi:hypothetical protein